MRRLVLQSFQSPGDVVMLTAAVRDLHAAAPGQFLTDVRTAADSLWDHNPHLTRLHPQEPGVEVVDMHYPLIHQSNQRPYHFLHGYAQYLGRYLDVDIPVTRFAGDIHLSCEEKLQPVPGADYGVPERFWIIVAGGKHDFTAKWWNPRHYQAVVDHFRGRLTFVQCGEAGHWHPPLAGVVNLVGKTSLREFVRLMYHADGVVCPVTFAMHLAAAVETRPGRPPRRPCVVIAGGREPAHWEAYPAHQFLSTNGALACCAEGGCWKSRCQMVGDGDPKDRHDVCTAPVQITPELRIAKCLDLIEPRHVIERIDLYYRGGALSLNGHSTKVLLDEVAMPAPPPQNLIRSPAPVANKEDTPKTRNVLLTFRHGLGDAVQFTIVLQHLQRLRPDWNVDVATLRGKHSAFRDLCRNLYILDQQESAPCCDYQERLTLSWDECREPLAHLPSTKPSQCLREVFDLDAQPELFHYQIAPRDDECARARRYFQSICPNGPRSDGRFPVVLVHYEGNTSGEKKNLTHDLARDLCEIAIRSGHVPVILDWDLRSPLPDGRLIHCPGAAHELWSQSSTGDAAALAALIESAALMIGIDSGPLHVAGATGTPTIGVWTKHHPVHYFDLADNVLHLIPRHHEDLAAGPDALDYFYTHYRHRGYNQLAIDLPALVEHQLTGADFDALSNQRFLKVLRARGYDTRYYEEHKQAGLDYLEYGDWQRQYGRWLVQSLGWQNRSVLDVGCACGSILRGCIEAGAVGQGVDLCEPMISLGRQHCPDLASRLHVCDAVHLHLFSDDQFDGIHSAQVAEHWRPELVPFILAELARVTAPGGLFFCALDTTELFARQGRTLEHEDPTHICIQPLDWWHTQLSQNGWELCTQDYLCALRVHSESFLNRYDWDWFVARRKS